LEAAPAGGRNTGKRLTKESLNWRPSVATSESTTPARRNRTPFAERVLSQALNRLIPPTPPLFVQAGELFHRASDELVIDRARRVLAQHFRTGAPLLSSPTAVADFLLLHAGRRDHEVFSVILLDVALRFIDYVDVSHGTLSSVRINPRQVVECVIAHHASAVILVHNHPSGDATPSRDDVCVTRNVRNALALIDVHVIDHFVVGASVVSMKSAGMIS
jgi:DNA repair protein RadC